MSQEMLRYIRGYVLLISMFAINFTLCYQAIIQGWDFGAVTFGIVILCIVSFITLERFIPYRKEWHPTFKEWIRDGTYFVLAALAGAIGQVLVYSIAFSLATPIGKVPLWSEIVLALLIGTLGGYCFHRLGHAVPFLWKIHGIHHMPVKVNLANNSVVHSFDVIGGAIFSQLPLLVLGFSEESMFISGAVTAMLGYFIHANIDIKLGWLNYVFATPQLHRLHHSVIYEEAGHYSTDLAFWDLVFNSFTWRKGKEVKDVGVKDSLAFPRSESIFLTLIHPFRVNYRRTE